MSPDSIALHLIIIIILFANTKGGTLLKEEKSCANKLIKHFPHVYLLERRIKARCIEIKSALWNCIIISDARARQRNEREILSNEIIARLKSFERHWLAFVFSAVLKNFIAVETSEFE